RLRKRRRDAVSQAPLHVFPRLLERRSPVVEEFARIQSLTPVDVLDHRHRIDGPDEEIRLLGKMAPERDDGALVLPGATRGLEAGTLALGYDVFARGEAQ